MDTQYRPFMWEEHEASHRSLVAKAENAPRLTNLSIRRDYLRHRGSAIVFDSASIRDGRPFIHRAWCAWSLRKHSEELERARMNAVDREALEMRNRHFFGGLAAPSLEWLMNEAQRKGLDENGQLEAVIHWGVRPDVYYEVPHPGAFGCHAPDIRRKREEKPNKEVIERLFSKAPVWSSTGDPEKPWSARVGKKQWQIRVNDFPEEHLFTLLIDGAEKLSFDNWPKPGKRPAQTHSSAPFL